MKITKKQVISNLDDIKQYIEEIEQEDNSILKCLYSDLKIGRIISKSDLFSYIGSDFKNWNLDNQKKVSVYELNKDATFKQMFNELNHDLDKLCLTQEQILSFIENYKDKLHPKGYATLFLLKENDEYFVADVYWDSSFERLGVDVSHFDDECVWRADFRLRVVAPQLQ